MQRWRFILGPLKNTPLFPRESSPRNAFTKWPSSCKLQALPWKQLAAKFGASISGQVDLQLEFPMKLWQYNTIGELREDDGSRPDFRIDSFFYSVVMWKTSDFSKNSYDGLWESTREGLQRTSEGRKNTPSSSSTTLLLCSSICTNHWKSIYTHILCM